MVEDNNYKKSGTAGAYSETALFTVKGGLQITYPDAQQHTWAVTETRTITWNVEHGNIQNVKIIGSRSGNFTGGADEFTIVNSTPADNVSTFNAGNTPEDQDRQVLYVPLSKVY